MLHTNKRSCVLFFSTQLRIILLGFTFTISILYHLSRLFDLAFVNFYLTSGVLPPHIRHPVESRDIPAGFRIKAVHFIFIQIHHAAIAFIVFVIFIIDTSVTISHFPSLCICLSWMYPTLSSYAFVCFASVSLWYFHCFMSCHASTDRFPVFRHPCLLPPASWRIYYPCPALRNKPYVLQCSWIPRMRSLPVVSPPDFFLPLPGHIPAGLLCLVVIQRLFQSGGNTGLELLGQFTAQRDPPLPSAAYSSSSVRIR